MLKFVHNITYSIRYVVNGYRKIFKIKKMGKKNKNKNKWLKIHIPIFAFIISLFAFLIPFIYKQGVDCGRNEGNKENIELKIECADLKKSCIKFESIIETLRDSIEILKVGEVIKTNDVNIANSIFKKQIEVLIRQGKDLLKDYDKQIDMTYKSDAWKSNVIGILNNKDKDIKMKIEKIENRYSPGDYYSQINDIINLLNNHLN